MNPFTKGVATTNALQDSNLHFDIMNIKFYLLSQDQEFAYFGEGQGRGLDVHIAAHQAHIHT